MNQAALRTLTSRLHGPIADLTPLDKSLLFAELSYLSYRSAELVGPAAEQIGLPQIDFFDNDGAQAYRLENNVDAVIACRGTEPHEWNDIQADIDAITALAETAGRVHRGFKEEVDNLWPMLEGALVGNDKALWFTGHSLGGAMATICAGRCVLSHIDSSPSGLFTFGSPRVGDRRYVNYVKLDHYRWVNNNDIVTRVPPTWMGYRHSGREMYLNSKGRHVKLAGLARFRDQLRGFVTGVFRGKIDHFSDHSIDCYIDGITQCRRPNRAI